MLSNLDKIKFSKQKLIKHPPALPPSHTPPINNFGHCYPNCMAWEKAGELCCISKWNHQQMIIGEKMRFLIADPVIARAWLWVSGGWQILIAFFVRIFKFIWKNINNQLRNSLSQGVIIPTQIERHPPLLLLLQHLLISAPSLPLPTFLRILLT